MLVVVAVVVVMGQQVARLATHQVAMVEMSVQPMEAMPLQLSTALVVVLVAHLAVLLATAQMESCL
jgi:hypothetical protein